VTALACYGHKSGAATVKTRYAQARARSEYRDIETLQRQPALIMRPNDHAIVVGQERDRVSNSRKIVEQTHGLDA
jgi:hypothetical protein